jgi:hypothetical protein
VVEEAARAEHLVAVVVHLREFLPPWGLAACRWRPGSGACRRETPRRAGRPPCCRYRARPCGRQCGRPSSGGSPLMKRPRRPWPKEVCNSGTLFTSSSDSVPR